MISSLYDICAQRAKMHDGKHVFHIPYHGCVWWLYKVHLLFSCEMLLAIEYHPRKEDVLLAVNSCSDTLRCAAFFRLQPAINLEKLRWSCRRSELQGMSGTGRSLCDLSKSVLRTSTLHGDWNAHWYAHAYHALAPLVSPRPSFFSWDRDQKSPKPQWTQRKAEEVLPTVVPVRNRAVDSCSQLKIAEDSWRVIEEWIAVDLFPEPLDFGRQRLGRILKASQRVGHPRWSGRNMCRT